MEVARIENPWYPDLRKELEKKFGNYKTKFEGVHKKDRRAYKDFK